MKATYPVAQNINRRLTPSAMPLSPGFHSNHHIEPSPSRPMSPGEQFSLMSVRERWEDEMAGEPSGNDLEVSEWTFASEGKLNNLPFIVSPSQCSAHTHTHTHIASAIQVLRIRGRVSG